MVLNEVEVTEPGVEKVAPGAVLDTTRPPWKSVPATVIGVMWPETTEGPTPVGSGARSMVTHAVQVPDPPVVVTVTSLGPRVDEKFGATFTVALRAVGLM